MSSAANRPQLCVVWRRPPGVRAPQGTPSRVAADAGRDQAGLAVLPHVPSGCPPGGDGGKACRRSRHAFPSAPEPPGGARALLWSRQRKPGAGRGRGASTPAQEESALTFPALQVWVIRHTLSPGAWPRPKPAGVGLCQAPGKPARAHAPRPQGVLPQPWGVTSSARPRGWAAGGRALSLCLAPFLGKLPAPSTGAARAGPPSDTLPSSSPPHLGQRRHGTSHPPRRARGDGAPVSGSPAWPGGPNSSSWGFLGAMTEEEGAPSFTGDPLCAWTPPGHLSGRSGSPLRSVLLSPLGVGR